MNGIAILGFTTRVPAEPAELADTDKQLAIYLGAGPS